MVLESFHALSRLTQSPATPPSGQLLGPSELFTLFFITLGPIKLLAPFVRLTRGLDDAARRRLALRATVIATAAVFAGGFLGVRVLSQWHVSTEVVLLAGGLVLLLVALALVLEQFEPPHPEAPGTMPVPPSAVSDCLPGNRDALRHRRGDRPPGGQPGRPAHDADLWSARGHAGPGSRHHAVRPPDRPVRHLAASDLRGSAGRVAGCAGPSDHADSAPTSRRASHARVTAPAPTDAAHLHQGPMESAVAIAAP